MVKDEYWHEKRIELKHVLSAWALVLVLLVVWLAFARLIGGTSCNLAAAVDGAGQLAFESCLPGSDALKVTADRRSR